MSSAILKFENVGKLYHLGEIGIGSLRGDVERWWKKSILGKPDPYLKIGEVNVKGKKSSSNIIWALKDISFQVNKGEMIGIIGKNGAGKSTLLKILSRITAPSLGTIKINGKITSLLEVGTGFHPELSGRENVYMNGAILGMTKPEIKAKFDEIVDFAGIYRHSIPTIISLIKKLLSEYEDNIKKYEEYKNLILKEEEKFDKDLSKILHNSLFI